MPRIEGVAGQSDDRKKLLIRRVIAYTVLVLLVFISLLPFYLLIVNATRGKVQSGIKFVPEGVLGDNFRYLRKRYLQTELRKLLPFVPQQYRDLSPCDYPLGILLCTHRLCDPCL